MAGRAAQRPRPVASLSVHTVDDPATQRALEQTQDAVQDLQQRARALLAITGRFLGRQVLTAASGIYTPTPGTTVIHAFIQAAGGGGGGATVGAGRGAGGGGTSGFLLDIVIGTPGTALTGGAFVCGAGGAAGSAAGGNGGQGGNAALTVNGRVYTAGGGGGGMGMVGVAGNGNALPLAPTAGTTPGGLTSFDTGGVGVVIGGTAWWSGEGGSSLFGQAGQSVGGDSAGQSATGYGAGASGAAAGTLNAAGGAGAPACILIEEYA